MEEKKINLLEYQGEYEFTYSYCLYKIWEEFSQKNDEGLISCKYLADEYVNSVPYDFDSYVKIDDLFFKLELEYYTKIKIKKALFKTKQVTGYNSIDPYLSRFCYYNDDTLTIYYFTFVDLIEFLLKREFVSTTRKEIENEKKNEHLKKKKKMKKMKKIRKKTTKKLDDLCK